MADNSFNKVSYTELELQRCFEIIQGNKKVPQAKCLGCFKIRAKNTTRQSEHVNKCLKARALMDPEIAKGKKQKLLSFSTSQPSRGIDQLIAQVCFSGARPFNLFDQPEMRDLIYALSPTYQIPSRHRIADDLLDEAYHGLQQEVLKELRRTQFLNVTVDETTNIRSQRVVVMTITTPTKSWFIHLNDMEDKTLDAPAISSWILNRLQGILLQLDKVVDWKRINSISTDTCHVMKSVWEKLEATPELKHCFMIPCDSHGLQLIMKDIVDPKSSKVPRAKEVFRSALEIVVFFHHSPLEYARMQAKQIEKWGYRKALIASVITRWGTQYNMLSSLHDCQEAICEWTLTTPAASTTRGREIVQTANSHSFWWQLKELIKILKPLHIAQKESEARNSSIMEVTQRWLYLHETLRTLASQTSLKDDFLSYLDGIGWQSRIMRQLEPIHWVAYHLDPARVPGKLDESSRYHIEGVLRPLQNEDRSSSAWHEFLSFRQKTGAFYNASCWKANCPSLFWLEAADFAPILAPFARRLCNTVANSAAAERAFSQMNLQHTKVRNRLESHRVEKLLFVQINKRQFRTEQPPKITQEFLLEEEDDEIERVLQRKQVQDHLSEGSVTSDTSSSPASSPTPSPTPGVESNLVSTLDINPDLNPEPEPEPNSEQDPEPTSAPNSAPTSALVSALNSALNSASGSANPALISALNSRLKSLLKPGSEPLLGPPTTPTPNSAHPIEPSSIRTSSDRAAEVGNTKGKKRLSEWPQGVAAHCEQPAQRRSGNKG